MALAIKKKTWIVLGFHLILLLVAGILFRHFWFSGDNQVYVRQRMNAPVNQTLDFTLTFEESHMEEATALLKRIQQKDLTPTEPLDMNSFLLNTEIDTSHLMPKGAVLVDDTYVYFDADRALSLQLVYDLNGGHYAVVYSLGNGIHKGVCLVDQPSKWEYFTIQNDSTLVEYWSH